MTLLFRKKPYDADMARWMGIGSKPGDRGELITPLGPGEVEKMRNLTPALGEVASLEAAQAAFEKWGLSGVGLREGEEWAGVILVAPQTGLPRLHPLSKGGIDPQTAGVIMVHIEPGLSSQLVGGQLCVSLSRRLHGRASGLEAQAGRVFFGSKLAPSALWLVRMGFRPLHYPTRRYRLDFSGMVPWYGRYLLHRRAPLSGKPVPANRS